MILDSNMVIKFGAMSTMNKFKWTQQLMKVIKNITLIWTDIVLKLLKNTRLFPMKKSQKKILTIFVFKLGNEHIWDKMCRKNSDQIHV